MSVIKPQLEYVEHFTVKGYSVVTQNSDEFSPETAKIPAVWQQYYSSPLSEKLPTVAVYSNFEADEHGFYMLTVGSVQDKNNVEANLVDVESGYYLVFKNKGTMPEAVINTWKQIWSFFEAESSYQRKFISDFEKYSESNIVTVYIGISKCD